MIEQHPVDAGAGLATVIPLPARHPAGDAQRAEEILERRAGARWRDIRDDIGRSAQRLEALLEAGPTAVASTETDAAIALSHTGRIISATAGVLELLGEEAPVLAEVLGAAVDELPFERLHEVADAVVGLGAAPPAVPTWAHRTEADAAAVVLQVSEEDLREAARSHTALYESFTESIWDVPSSLLAAGRRPWRFVSRARLRRELRAASRSGRVPGRVGVVSREVLEARGARDRLTGLAPLLSHHLRSLDRGPLSDVDGAQTSLAAVRRLQDALGELLDGDRLERLLLADAFRSHDVIGPAVAVRTILQAWANDVRAVGGDRPWDLDAVELEEWALEVALGYRDVESANEALDHLGVEPRSLRSLVDLLLLREHVAEQERGSGTDGVVDVSGHPSSVISSIRTSISGSVS